MARVKLGTIINVRGLKGEVKVNSSTSFAKERYQKGNKVYLINKETNDEKVVTVIKGSTVGPFNFVMFEEITTVEQANLFRGYDIEIETDNFTKLDNDSFYFFELVGCKVYDEDNNLVGEVSEVLDNTAQDIIRVKTDKTDILVPFIKVFIKDVDIENKKIIIHMMEGLR